MRFDFEETMNSVSLKMKIDFEYLTKQIEHKELKGRAREIVIKKFLAKYLPLSLGVKSGEIVSSNGNVSKQMDIIIFDNLNCPIFLREDEVHIFPIESVYAVIEVKSHLNSEELEDCMEKIYSVKRMPKNAYVKTKDAIINTVNLYGKEYEYFPTLGFVFAFDSMGLKALVEQMDKLNGERNIELENRIDTIGVLKKGIITNLRTDGLFGCTPQPESELVGVPTNKSLLLFYSLLMTVLNQVWMPPIQLTEYIKNVKFSDVIYRKSQK